MKPPNVKCKFCEKAVYMPFNRLKTFKYCSKKCVGLAMRQQIKAFCAICKKEFEHISSRCNKAKYCSRNCYYKAQTKKGKTIYQCFHCHKNFKGSLSHKRKFCSKACVGKETRKTWKPKFTTVRKKMLKEGCIKECEICGYNEVPEILGIHHKDGDRNNNKRENLQVVCPLCHSLLHRKHISH